MNLDFQLDGARLNFSIRSTHCAWTGGHGWASSKKGQNRETHAKKNVRLSNKVTPVCASEAVELSDFFYECVCSVLSNKVRSFSHLAVLRVIPVLQVLQAAQQINCH